MKPKPLFAFVIYDILLTINRKMLSVLLTIKLHSLASLLKYYERIHILAMIVSVFKNFYKSV